MCSTRGPSLDSQGSRVAQCGVWAECVGAGYVSKMEGRMWFPLNNSGRNHHCNCSWSMTGRAGLAEAADFAMIFMQKNWNKQTQNDY